MSLPADIITTVDSVLGGYTASAYGAIASKVAPSLYAASTLVVAFYGWAVLSDKVQHPLGTMFRNVFAIGFVLMAALQWTWFSYIYDIFTNGPQTFVASLTGGQNEITALDNFYDRGMDTAFAILGNAGMTDFGQIIMGVIVFLITAIQTAVAIYLLVTAKMVTALLLILAPIYIGFAMFQTTRGYTMNWFGTLLNLFTFRLLLGGCLYMSYEVYRTIVPSGQLYTSGQLSPNTMQDKILPLVMILGISTFLLKRLTDYAASLTGNAASLSSGAASTVMNRAKNAVQVANRAAMRRQGINRASQRHAARQQQAQNSHRELMQALGKKN